ncbi:MAG: type II toxin-antitoxin system RelE/ParE family toxin [Chitinivibrionales bacterium]|nr:type II toxin-antitoxin system RelE/ParE family toxin [Chitinivibrionales bacterium]
MKPVRLLHTAELEMLDAARYYELQAPGLGIDYLDKIDSAIHDVEENPEQWPTIRFNIRRRLVHRFPYGLLYRIDTEEIIVLAVMHLRRHPDYWISRL